MRQQAGIVRAATGGERAPRACPGGQHAEAAGQAACSGPLSPAEPATTERRGEGRQAAPALTRRDASITSPLPTFMK